MPALHNQPATSLAALIRAGDVSSREVVDAHLARIEEQNGAHNALTIVLADAARTAADDADRVGRACADPTTLGALHGVPFTVKENIDCAGSATTHGVRALKQAMPYVDAPAV